MVEEPQTPQWTAEQMNRFDSLMAEFGQASIKYGRLDVAFRDSEYYTGGNSAAMDDEMKKIQAIRNQIRELLGM